MRKIHVTAFLGFAAAAVLSLVIVAAWQPYYQAGYQAGAGSGHQYVPTRQAMLLAQATQVPPGTVMLLGDSIIDSLYIFSANFPIFNAGIGSATVETWDEFAPRLFALVKPKIVIIAIGINNTSRDNFNAEIFQNYYFRLCAVAKENSQRVILSTILPVSQDMPLGARYNLDRIHAVNSIIRQFAKNNGYELIDSFSYFADTNDHLPAHLTIDGVHLNAAGYGKWKNIILPCLDN